MNRPSLWRRREARGWMPRRVARSSGSRRPSRNSNRGISRRRLHGPGMLYRSGRQGSCPTGSIDTRSSSKPAYAQRPPRRLGTGGRWARETSPPFSFRLQCGHRSIRLGRAERVFPQVGRGFLEACSAVAGSPATGESRRPGPRPRGHKGPAGRCRRAGPPRRSCAGPWRRRSPGR
jgi:hypothetical protein